MARVAIVYDSSTGTTKAAAEQMGEATRAAGHDCSVDSIHDADPAEVSAADVICVGSWTKGLYVIRPETGRVMNANDTAAAIHHSAQLLHRGIGILQSLRGELIPDEDHRLRRLEQGGIAGPLVKNLRAKAAHVARVFEAPSHEPSARRDFCTLDW